jgi:hypothetical protein
LRACQLTPHRRTDVLQGVPFSAEWNATAKEAHVQYRQANKIWSLIHTLMANTADPMRAASVEASRALAVWLRQYFMCTNCRGARAAPGAAAHACSARPSARRLTQR